MVMQADGEVIGEGPFTAEMVKEAIDIIAPDDRPAPA